MSNVVTWLESPEGQDWSRDYHMSMAECPDPEFASIRGQDELNEPDPDLEEVHLTGAQWGLSWRAQGERDLSADPTGSYRDREPGE